MNEPLKVAFGTTHEGRRLALRLDGGRGNVIDTAMAQDLASVLERETRSEHLKAVTLSAVGPHFSYGASVPEHAPEMAEPLIRGLHQVVRMLVDFDVPVIAAVRGRCLGGALELVLPCHRVIVSPDAYLGLPEVTLGMFAPAGSVLLPERVARGLAEEMLLTGRVLNADEALECGLVDAIEGDPDEAAEKWFEEALLPRSASALRFATRAARASMRPRVHAAIDVVEKSFLDELMQTADAKEGVASFLEKREPQWVDS